MSSRTDEAGEALLARVGERVRNLRARRGMTRRMLSRDSAVSERYLAQLERGEGNVSIVLLQQIAGALEVEPGELLAPDTTAGAEQALLGELVQRLSADEQREALQLLYGRFAQPGGARRRIALVGLRGAGKSTLGRLAAAHLGVPFVQLVNEVERLGGMNVSEIFSLSGQAGYRRLEEQALLEVLGGHERCVIETGGSLVAEPRTLNTLLTTCFVIWIRADPEQHMQRVIEQGDFRPMARNPDAMDDLRRILAEREAYYAQAHAVVDTTARTVEDSLQDLVAVATGTTEGMRTVSDLLD